MNAAVPHKCEVSIGSGNGLVPPGNKPGLTEPIDFSQIDCSGNGLVPPGNKPLL